jgi:hypothetical protein
MQEQYMIKWLILFVTIIECAHSLEIFIKKTNSNNDQNIEPLKSFYNKTYQIPLFQTRYITIRINRDDLRRNKNVHDHDVVGFKFQVKSTDNRIVDVQKEILVTTNANSSNNVLLEDLFICKLMIYKDALLKLNERFLILKAFRILLDVKMYDGQKPMEIIG